jgi:hypothetical protein
MNPSVLYRQCVLQFAVAVLSVAPAFSQAPPKYDAATETTLKFTIAEVKMVPPDGAKQIAYLLPKPGSEKEPVQIFLCPKKFLDEIGVAFKADDAIQVTGSKVKQDGNDLILAREVVKGGETLTFRFQDGKPAW